jgi:hypothetical protein
LLKPNPFQPLTIVGGFFVGINTKRGDSVALTAKQEKYVQGLVAGLSQRQAYKEAYDTSRMKDESIDQVASRLLKNIKVLSRYNELMDEYKKQAIWTREKAEESLSWLLDKAVEDLEEQGFRQANSSSYLNAIQELNKLNDLYPTGKQEINLSGGVQFVDDI